MPVRYSQSCSQYISCTPFYLSWSVGNIGASTGKWKIFSHQRKSVRCLVCQSYSGIKAEFIGYYSKGLTRVEIVTNGGRFNLGVTEKSRLRHHKAHRFISFNLEFVHWAICFAQHWPSVGKKTRNMEATRSDAVNKRSLKNEVYSSSISHQSPYGGFLKPWQAVGSPFVSACTVWKLSWSKHGRPWWGYWETKFGQNSRGLGRRVKETMR